MTEKLHATIDGRRIKRVRVQRAQPSNATEKEQEEAAAV